MDCEDLGFVGAVAVDAEVGAEGECSGDGQTLHEGPACAVARYGPGAEERAATVRSIPASSTSRCVTKRTMPGASSPAAMPA